MSAKFTQRMPKEIDDKIEQLANDYGVSKNEMINMACDEFTRSGRLPDLEKRVSELEKELASMKKK